MKNKNKKLLLLILPFVFFIFFSFYDGVILCVDTNTYINLDISREPIYPLFLLLLKTIFGNDIYLTIAVLLQGLLMAYAVYSISSYLEKEFNLNLFMTLIIQFLFLFVSLLCRFAAKRGSMYSNSILSESIAYPLFIIFFRYLLEYLFTNSKKALCIASFISFVLISTRKQMYLSLFLLILVFIYHLIVNKIYRKFYEIIIICILVIFANKCLDLAYNIIAHGFSHTHTSSNRFLTTMVVYCSKEEDANYINDKNVREIFIEVNKTCKEKDLLMHRDINNWYERSKHFCDSYDLIQLRNMWPMIRQYISDNYSIYGNELEYEVDKYNSEIIKSILPNVIPDMLLTVFDNIRLGLMTTVSAVNEVFKIYTFMIVFLYVLLLIYTAIKTRLSKYTLIGCLSLISIIINVVMVSCLIFPQTRYTIYNMALFYVTGLLMIYSVFKNKFYVNNK